jgi:hypothetical protein
MRKTSHAWKRIHDHLTWPGVANYNLLDDITSAVKIHTGAWECVRAQIETLVPLEVKMPTHRHLARYHM